MLQGISEMPKLPYRFRAGLLGLCLWGNGLAQAATLPDLIIHEAAVDPFISTVTFESDECAVVEGCIVAGTRRILRFDTETRNVGAGDLVLGNPQDPENPYAQYYVYRECQGSYKMEKQREKNSPNPNHYSNRYTITHDGAGPRRTGLQEEDLFVCCFYLYTCIYIYLRCFK